MFRARFLTSWVQVAGRNEMYPATLGLPLNVTDVTGQLDANIPTSPNFLVVEVEGRAIDLDTIASDSNCSELWREEVTNAQP